MGHYRGECHLLVTGVTLSRLNFVDIVIFVVAYFALLVCYCT